MYVHMVVFDVFWWLDFHLWDGYSFQFSSSLLCTMYLDGGHVLQKKRFGGDDIPGENFSVLFVKETIEMSKPIWAQRSHWMSYWPPSIMDFKFLNFKQHFCQDKVTKSLQKSFPSSRLTRVTVPAWMSARVSLISSRPSSEAATTAGASSKTNITFAMASETAGRARMRQWRNVKTTKFHPTSFLAPRLVISSTPTR